MQKTYALFDFDGTLRGGDSIVALCWYAHQRGLCATGDLLKGMAYAVGYGLRLCSAAKAKAAAMGWLKGRLLSEMDALAQQFCLNVLVPQMYPQGLEALRNEKARGATVLLITASPSFYLEPLKSMLGIDDVIGTRMALDERERFTGDVCGDNCRGVQKPLRLAEYLAAKGDRLDYASSSAYGDSYSDLPMMALCSQKVAVNPKRRLMRALGKAESVKPVAWRLESKGR